MNQSFRGSNWHNMKRPFICFIVLLMLIIAPSMVLSQNNPYENITEEDICVASELLINSQGDTPYIGGAGDVTMDISAIIKSGDILLPMQLDQHGGLSRETVTDFEDNKDVLLLVIDDFSTKLKYEVEDGDEIVERTSQRTHGEYVMEVATATYHAAYNGYSVVMFPVNYAPAPTAEFPNGAPPTLSDVITSTRNAFTAIDNIFTEVDENHKFDSVVLNMSWVLLGCIVEEPTDGGIAYNYNEFYTNYASGEINNDFVDYLSQRHDMTRNAVIEALSLEMNAFAQSMEAQLIDFMNLLNGELFTVDTIKDDPSVGTVIPIAAAGNFGTDETLAPAKWSNVLAVSGSHADHPRSLPNNQCSRQNNHNGLLDDFCMLWESSNFGQVTAPAAWHPTITNEYVAGTSFATPMVSVLTSIAASHPNCRVQPTTDLTGLMNMMTISKDENRHFFAEIMRHCQQP